MLQGQHGQIMRTVCGAHMSIHAYMLTYTHTYIHTYNTYILYSPYGWLPIRFALGANSIMFKEKIVTSEVAEMEPYDLMNEHVRDGNMAATAIAMRQETKNDKG